jgi:hypothetical protein
VDVAHIVQELSGTLRCGHMGKGVCAALGHHAFHFGKGLLRQLPSLQVVRAAGDVAQVPRLMVGHLQQEPHIAFIARHDDGERVHGMHLLHGLVHPVAEFLHQVLLGARLCTLVGMGAVQPVLDGEGVPGAILHHHLVAVCLDQAALVSAHRHDVVVRTALQGTDQVARGEVVVQDHAVGHRHGQFHHLGHLGIGEQRQPLEVGGMVDLLHRRLDALHDGPYVALVVVRQQALLRLVHQVLQVDGVLRIVRMGAVGAHDDAYTRIAFDALQGL